MIPARFLQLIDLAFAGAAAVFAVYTWQHGWYYSFAIDVTIWLSNLIDYANRRPE